MSFYKKLEYSYKNSSIDSKKIVLGHQINPLKIIEISTLFPSLNLRKEEIILVFLENKQIVGLLTNHYYFKLQHSPIPIQECREDNFQLETHEKQFVFEAIGIFTEVKQENRNDLDSFLDKFANKEDENDQILSEESFFDKDYVEMLNHEAKEARNMCIHLNEDAQFLQALNLLFEVGDQAIDGYKAEHLLLADFIKVYEIATILEDQKSKFTLAYFFEKIQGNDLAKNISIIRLNEMVSKAGFEENIQKIKNATFFSLPKEYEQGFILPQILSKLNHDYFAKSGNIIYRFATILIKADGKINEEEKKILKDILNKTTLIVKSKAKFEVAVPEDDSLEKVLKELHSLIGLEEVKKSIQDLINFLTISNLRESKEMPKLDLSLHSVFLGPPGTGKTTIARLLGRIYKHLNYLTDGQLIETDRAGMVAGYVGQTALKVDELVKESIGGVLFIDEAYALYSSENGRDFGSEAIDTLLKRMEDQRNNFVVVVAGYTEPMGRFIESNPGLRSRFNRYYSFQHFLPQQLMEIFKRFCNKYDFKLSVDAEEKLFDTFEMLYEKRDEGFGNARVVRNLFEICTQNQANRLILLTEINEELLQTIVESDIPEPQSTVKKVYLTQKQND